MAPEPLIMLAVAVARVGAAFSLTPFLAREIVPGMVRICMMMSLAAWVLTVSGWDWLAELDGYHLGAAIARETLIGLLLGFVFSGILWSFQIAGQLIAQKVGGDGGAAEDPFYGGPETTFALLLTRFSAAVFGALGGVTVFVQVIVASYALWPIGRLDLRLQAGSAPLTDAFQGLVAYGVMLAAPVLVLLTVAEGAIGLLNRAAPRLNAFAFALSAKGWLASLIVLLVATQFAADLREGVQSLFTSSLDTLGRLLR